MTMREFNALVDAQVSRCLRLLAEKGFEYAPDANSEADTGDRMAHFRASGESQGLPAEQALWGMLDKHLRSLAQICKNPDNWPLAVWDEKMTDAINYLLLLSALVHESEGEKSW